MSITREEHGTYTSQVRVKDWTCLLDTSICPSPYSCKRNHCEDVSGG